MNKPIKIYFSGSIRGGRQDVKIYRKLIDELKKYSIVLTEYVGFYNLTIEYEKTD